MASGPRHKNETFTDYRERLEMEENQLRDRLSDKWFWQSMATLQI